jgi:hypothetical protein
MEVRMEGTGQEAKQEQRKAERLNEDNRAGAVGSQPERGNRAAQQQAERLAELSSERMRQAAEASTTAASGILDSGSAVAGGAQEITAAWARYAEEVMRHTSEASQALLRARSFADMLEIQAKLLRNNMQALLDQSVTITEAASRMATRPFEAIRNAGTDQARR